jgi:hypothetical protein
MARRPFLDAAEEQLPRYGYRVIRVVRTVGICHWLLARRVADDQLVELEAYDRALTNPLNLTAYNNHTPTQLSNGNATTRFPVDQINSDRIFAFVRPWVRGEPLYALLLRPGRVPTARVATVVGGAGVTLRRALQDTDLPPMAAVANLFVSEDGEVLLDAAAEGPWLTASDARPLLQPFFQTDEDADDVAMQRFVDQLYVRLTTGSLKPSSAQLDALRDAKMLTPAEDALVERLVGQTRPSGWLHEQLLPKRRRIPWGMVALVVLALSIGGAAASQHRLLAAREWQGEAIKPAAVAQAKTSGSQAPVAGVDENQAVFVPYRLAEARREAKAGDFANAYSILDALERNEQIEGEDRLAVRQARTEINAATAAAFTAMMDRGRSLYEAGEEETALRLLETAIKTFPDNPQMRQATDLANAIRHVTKERMRRELDADLARRRVAALRREQVQTVLDLHLPLAERRFRGHLRLAQERLRGTPEAELLQLLHDAAVAEENLFYGLLTTAAGPRKRELVRACTPAWAAGRPVRVNEIRAGGIVEIGSEGLAVVKWSQVSYEQALGLFAAGRGVVAPDDHDYTLDLYRYCVRRRLPQAEAYAKKLAGTRHQRIVTRMRKLWERLEGTVVATDEELFGTEE